MRRWLRRTGRQGEIAPIVVVSGLPRSGTSMMMRMLAAGGIEPLTDGERKPDADNPGGYYELERVKALTSGDTRWLADAPGRAVKVIATLLYDLPEAHDYRVVFMRRRMEEILASQRQMLVNRGEDPDAIPDEEMARIFRGHLERLEAWLASRPDVRLMEVDYNLVLAGDIDETLGSLVAFLERPLDVHAMRQVVDESLYRRRA